MGLCWGIDRKSIPVCDNSLRGNLDGDITQWGMFSKIIKDTVPLKITIGPALLWLTQKLW